MRTKRVCKKCKLKLFVREKAQYRIRIKNGGSSFCSSQKRRIPDNAQEFSIFRNMDSFHDFVKRIRPYMMTEIKSEGPPHIQDQIDYESKYYLDQFFNLKCLVSRIILGRRIQQAELDYLTKLEGELLIAFCKKKKLYNYQVATLTSEYFDTVIDNPKHKSKEENFKFIFKKIYKFLKSRFELGFENCLLELLNSSIRALPNSSRFEYMFLGYFFQKNSFISQTRLETYFQPCLNRNFPIFNEELAAKSINKRFIRKLRESREFIFQSRQYLEKCLENECMRMMVEKGEELIGKWEEVLIEEGVGQLKKKIGDLFRKKSKAKMPWTMVEIRFAIRQVLEILK